jgi:hypothetical protein
MKISDLGNLDKEDILSVLGLVAKPTASGRLLGSVGIFAVGCRPPVFPPSRSPAS